MGLPGSKIMELLWLLFGVCQPLGSIPMDTFRADRQAMMLSTKAVKTIFFIIITAFQFFVYCIEQDLFPYHGFVISVKIIQCIFDVFGVQTIL
jgi:fumarate reductase subunit D